jgi:CspA family cold shock protein
MNPTTQEETSEISTVLVDRLTGTVKWFNNRSGYGFITVCDGEYAGKDIFVHYKSINVKNSQYKYLVQGEYVDFTLVKSARDNHEYQATNVSGVKGGPILCETRRLMQTPDVRVGGFAPDSRRPRVAYEQRRPRDESYRPKPATAADTGFTPVVRRRPRPTTTTTATTTQEKRNGSVLKKYGVEHATAL